MGTHLAARAGDLEAMVKLAAEHLMVCPSALGNSSLVIVFLTVGRGRSRITELERSTSGRHLKHSNGLRRQHACLNLTSRRRPCL
jgi:hypothetical protein